MNTMFGVALFHQRCPSLTDGIAMSNPDGGFFAQVDSGFLLFAVTDQISPDTK